MHFLPTKDIITFAFEKKNIYMKLPHNINRLVLDQNVSNSDSNITVCKFFSLNKNIFYKENSSEYSVEINLLCKMRVKILKHIGKSP